MTPVPPDRWLALTVRIPSRVGGDALWELVPELLLELGGRGVEEKDGGFTTYLLPPPDLEKLLATARSRLEALGGSGDQLQWGWQPQEDWELLWRRGLGPRRISDSLVVAPSWDVPEVEAETILIVLDPGMAFGTAEHATTRGCLRLLESRVEEGDRVADVGAGSGILSIAAVRFGARSVLAVEVDPMACEAARENLLANGVQDRVRMLEAEVRAGEPLPDGPFDGIVANIQRSILLPILPAFLESLRPGGWIILSGILLEEREEVLARAVDLPLTLLEEDAEEEWWTGAFRKPSPKD